MRTNNIRVCVSVYIYIIRTWYACVSIYTCTHTYIYTCVSSIQLYSVRAVWCGTAPDYPLKGSWKMYFPRAYSEKLHPTASAHDHTPLLALRLGTPPGILYDWWTSLGFSLVHSRPTIVPTIYLPTHIVHTHRDTHTQCYTT
jgi:hypothetical protein